MAPQDNPQPGYNYQPSAGMPSDNPGWQPTPDPVQYPVPQDQGYSGQQPYPDQTPYPQQQQSYPGQTFPAQPYPEQAYPEQPYPEQAYPEQPYSGQPYSAQPYSGQPYSGQPYSGQPYPGQQPYPNQGFPGQAPPPQRRGSTGLIVGITAGIAALILVCAGVGIVAWRSGQSDDVVAGQSNDPTSTATSGPTSSSPSATATATGEYRDASTLDSEDTDNTPFSTDQAFHDVSFTSTLGNSYTLVGTDVDDACTEAGGSLVRALLEENGCGDMVVGVYLTDSEAIMVGVMVIPLPDADSATTVFDAIDSDSDVANDLAIWCPGGSQPGSQICDMSSIDDVYRYYSYNDFHRYLVLSAEMYTDGRSSGEATELTDAGSDCLAEVQDSLLRIY